MGRQGHLPAQPEELAGVHAQGVLAGAGEGACADHVGLAVLAERPEAALQHGVPLSACGVKQRSCTLRGWACLWANGGGGGGGWWLPPATIMHTARRWSGSDTDGIHTAVLTLA